MVGVIRPVVQVRLRIMNPLSFVANTANRSLVEFTALNLGSVPGSVMAKILTECVAAPQAYMNRTRTSWMLVSMIFTLANGAARKPRFDILAINGIIQI